jgi:hypothetical protein
VTEVLVNWQYRVLALALAVLSWYLITGREKVETWIDVPVEFVGAPRNMVIREGLRTAITVRMRGAKGIIRGLDARDLAYSMDLSGLTPGENVITFERGNLHITRAVDVVEIVPPRMVLQVDPLAERKVPVEPVWRGRLDADWELRGRQVRPPQVTLRGPEQIVSRIDAVSTLPVMVNSTTPGRVQAEIGLALPEEVASVPPQVGVDFDFGVKRKEVWVKLPVTLRPEMEGARVLPPVVQLQVRAPLSLVRSGDFKEQMSAFVPVDQLREAGGRRLRYRIFLPPEVILLKAVPEEVEVVLDKPAPAGETGTSATAPGDS